MFLLNLERGSIRIKMDLQKLYLILQKDFYLIVSVFKIKLQISIYIFFQPPISPKLVKFWYEFGI